ncbi:probable metalloreductase Aim14p [Trichomonascus vanleenenianus]|uniref:putative ferric-chelate reductase n=1 Tax=Trichomonascus vanleenenianus TaxID=2268995 RepID=UPI003ECAFB09
MYEIYPKVPKEVKKYRTFVTRKYGYYTLAAAFAFILAVCLYNYLWPRLAGRKSLRHRAVPTPRLGQRTNSFVFVWSRLLAQLSVKVSLIVIGWTVVLGYFVFSETNNDLTFLVKRLGRVSVALMPPVYFLTLKPSPLPHTFYLQLLPFHKWLSRTVVVIATIHGALYIYVYCVTGKLHKLLKPANLAGFAATGCFILIALTSLKPFRRRYYRSFFGIHYTLAWLCVGLVWKHSAPPSNDYMALCGAILVGQIFYRVYKTDHISLPVQFVSPTLYFVSIPKSALPKCLGTHFTPGAHVRITSPLSQVSTWFQSSHPYTIASLPHQDTLDLVIRKTQYPIKMRKDYSINGPYKSLPDTFMEAVHKGLIRRVLFVIGGSGIAFGAPVLRYLKFHNVKVKMLWAIRDERDVRVLEMLGLQDSVNNQEIEVYVTAQTAVSRSLLQRKSSVMSIEEHMFGKEREQNDDEGLGISIDNYHCNAPEQASLVSHGDNKMYSTIEYVDYDEFSDEECTPQIFNYRPVLNLRLKYWLCGLTTDNNDCCCIDQLLDIGPQEREGAWVVTSGADRLVTETKKWANQNGFSFLQEEFTL